MPPQATTRRAVTPSERTLIEKMAKWGMDRPAAARHIYLERNIMKKAFVICSLLLLAPLAFSAQHGRAASTGSTHSNAPARAATDRDKGKDRAADVGKGKKKGLTKHTKQNKGKG